MDFVFIITFVLCFGALWLFIKYAEQLGLYDVPNIRSMHKQATPSSSGIAVFIAVFIVSIFADMGDYENYSMLIVAVFMVFLLGVFDDIKNFPAKYKLIVIATAALMTSFDNIIVWNAGVFFGYKIVLAWYIAIPFTIFAITSFTNSFNLIDGLDGLAGTLSIIILSALWYLGYTHNDFLLFGIPSLIIPAMLAFLYFNWNPAKTFMGDSGSLTLGFLIAILSIRSLNYVEPMMLLYLVALPVIDTIVIIIRRKKAGYSIFKPDKNHSHHVFLRIFNGNVKTAVTVLAMIQLIYVLFGITLASSLPQEVLLLIFAVNVVGWYLFLSRKSFYQAQIEV
jgi:UDP-GlcNAc:undecaprenyl-phosphate GlcNAc-1-phosphate transferase